MSNSDDVLIKVENVSKKFCRSLKRSMLYGIEDIARDSLHLPDRSDLLRKDEFWAVDDVSFEVKRGECLGIIGRNGAGKSTLLKMLNGIFMPDKGKITIKGKVGALIEVGAGFHPMLTGRENVYVNGAILGMSKREIDWKFDEIVAFAELEEFIDMPVKHYSSGMYVRLGFAIAAQMEPDILILDEVLAVGDMNFQSKCLQRLGENLPKSAVILVSHYPHHIKKMCDSAMLLKTGVVASIGTSDQVLKIYQESNQQTIQQPLTLLAPEINNAKIKNVTEKTSTGNYLEFDIVIDSNQSFVCDQSYINLVDQNEVVHAQIILHGLQKNISKGITQHHIKIGPLHLSFGHFSANLVLYGKGGKSTIIHLRHCLSFDFDGPPSLGPVYYPSSFVFEHVSSSTSLI